MRKETVLSFFGNDVATAKALTQAGHKISRVAVIRWPEVIPELRARQLHDVTGGELYFKESVYQEFI